ALATSFLGVSLGLFDFVATNLKHGDDPKGRSLSALITFIPPLGFISALGYGAIALVILAVFLPVAMVWRQRKARDSANLPTGYRVAGGNAALLLASLCGLGVIGAQLLS
ncbi:MAG: aromatic amino acid transport family protein, partial [Shewanella sp.]